MPHQPGKQDVTDAIVAEDQAHHEENGIDVMVVD
jgi:hypothetical protein